jgi:hypothetical protein
LIFEIGQSIFGQKTNDHSACHTQKFNSPQKSKGILPTMTATIAPPPSHQPMAIEKHLSL